MDGREQRRPGPESHAAHGAIAVCFRTPIDMLCMVRVFLGLPDVEPVEAVGAHVEDAPRELARQLVVRHVEVGQVGAVLGQRLVAVAVRDGRQAEGRQGQWQREGVRGGVEGG